MVKPSLPHLISRGLHALLATAPWATQRLQPFSGQSLSCHLGHWSWHFDINAQGFLEWRSSPPEKPSLTLHLAPSALPGFLANPTAALHHLHLSGNSALAAEIGFLAKHFRPDLEELLSHAIGDGLAHRVGKFWRQTRSWARDSGSRWVTMVREYATEEADLLPHPSQQQAFAAQVTALSLDLDRLEQRIARLI
ncbi:MAG: hypothetical protein G3H99_03905 [Ferrovum sp.]|nr:hypothetical protein [Ferrovum sp.]NDU87843.1 hypothetical protein [Ferrovum sp.]